MNAFGERGIVRQNAAVVNAAIALGDAGNSTHIFIRTTDRYVFQRYIFHHATVNSVEERMIEARKGLRAAIERTAEGLGDGGGATEVERSGGNHLIM